MSADICPARCGSLTPSGTINLNVNLVKALSDTTDYIILHELCQRKQVAIKKSEQYRLQSNDGKRSDEENNKKESEKTADMDMILVQKLYR
jgi:hypothetical protein